jgi:hypothetical protein
MTTATDRRSAAPDELVRLVYHYTDGHDFATDPMLRTDAVAYMPLLRAVPVDDDHYHATFGEIELRHG